MRLEQQETLALEMIFRGTSGLSDEIKKRMKDAKVLDRDMTGVGFYSTIKLESPLDEVPEIRMWEYNFKHPDFPYGGSYMCTIVNNSELELEAVTLGGANWPNPVGPELFEEL